LPAAERFRVEYDERGHDLVTLAIGTDTVPEPPSTPGSSSNASAEPNRVIGGDRRIGDGGARPPGRHQGSPVVARYPTMVGTTAAAEEGDRRRR
jgi:hypothetical protein